MTAEPAMAQLIHSPMRVCSPLTTAYAAEMPIRADRSINPSLRLYSTGCAVHDVDSFLVKGAVTSWQV